MSGKRLELLKETVPRVSRIALLWNLGNPGGEDALKETETVARGLGIRLQRVGIRSASGLRDAFSKIIKEHSGALVVQQDALFTGNREKVVELAAKNRLPTIYSFTEFMDVRGLMSYGPSRLALFQEAAIYVDRQDPERREARRSASRAADEVRNGDQSENGETYRPHDSTVGVVPGGQGDQVKIKTNSFPYMHPR